MVSRRMMLVTGAAGVVVIGAAGLKLHSNLGPARRPWFDAGKGYDDARLDALSYAVLAPSPHNLQPWLIRLDGDEGMTLFCNLERRLPATDPYDRQTVIGLGAFLELLRQAAAELGFTLESKLFPEGESFPVLDGRPIARLRLNAAASPKDPLFSALLLRRTSRKPFDQARPVTPETMTALYAVLHAGAGDFSWAVDKVNLEALKTICRKAWRIEMATPATRFESVRYTRIGEKEINQKPDGISLFGPVMEAMGATGILTRATMDDPTSRAYAETIRFYENNINTAMAFGWLTTETNTRLDQLRAGASWVRLQQAAARFGLAMHPLSQALQEYPEMAEIYDEIHQFAASRPPACVQGLFRFGYAPDEPPSPRWPLSTKLIGAGA